jgi:O-methyltransferase involved in polyketide biosynthesis
MRSRIDTTRPHPARVYDCLLGGKDHFAVDRKTAEALVSAVPIARNAVRENRAFLGRAVRYLVAEAGIRQFLDIGTGLPSANNVHEVAQAIAPETRVVYVDNDPIVLSHARALLTSSPEGKTSYIDADLREPEKILAAATAAGTLDFTKPLALMLVAVLHFLPDAERPAEIVSTLVDALPPGSFLVATHFTPEYDPKGAAEATRIYAEAGMPLQGRTGDELAELAFGGLTVVDPGLVLVSDWRPKPGLPRPSGVEVGFNGAVARKP